MVAQICDCTKIINFFLFKVDKLNGICELYLNKFDEKLIYTYPL